VTKAGDRCPVARLEDEPTCLMHRPGEARARAQAAVAARAARAEERAAQKDAQAALEAADPGRQHGDAGGWRRRRARAAALRAVRRRQQTPAATATTDVADTLPRIPTWLAPPIPEAITALEQFLGDERIADRAADMLTKVRAIMVQEVPTPSGVSRSIEYAEAQLLRDAFGLVQELNELKKNEPTS
jgi:hypothetical protein